MTKQQEIEQKLANRSKYAVIAQLENTGTPEQVYNSTDVRTPAHENTGTREQLPTQDTEPEFVILPASKAKRRKAKRNALEQVVESYKSDANEEDPFIRRAYFIRQSLAKKMEYLRSMYFTRKGKQLDLNVLVNAAIEEYVDELYIEFKTLPAENPFGE